jgi:hypothetical protein
MVLKNGVVKILYEELATTQSNEVIGLNPRPKEDPVMSAKLTLSGLIQVIPKIQVSKRFFIAITSNAAREARESFKKLNPKMLNALFSFIAISCNISTYS